MNDELQYLAQHLRSMIEVLASTETAGSNLHTVIRQDAYDAMNDLADEFDRVDREGMERD